MSNRRRIRRRDSDGPYPWDVLCAGSSPAERRMLFEMRRICLEEGGFDVDELVPREGELSDEARTRTHDLADLLEAMGTWRRLERLVVGGYGLGARAALN